MTEAKKVPGIQVKDAEKEEQDMLYKLRDAIDKTIFSDEFSGVQDSLLLTVASAHLVEIVARMLVIRGYNYNNAEKVVGDLFDNLKINFAEEFKQLASCYNIQNIEPEGNC